MYWSIEKSGLKIGIKNKEYVAREKIFLDIIIN